jgi:hypothetical protein
MAAITRGERVHVAGEGPTLDGIVFSYPSRSKAVVAVVDPKRGPVLRTVARKDVTERTQDGPDDTALQLLVRRMPPPVGGHAGSAPGSAHGRSGHSRAAMHRTTGK